jgi:hypothetical protein
MSLAEGVDLHEEGTHGVLKGSDRTVGVGKGGLKMRENLLCGAMHVRALRIWGWTSYGQCRADLALAKDESLPKALQGSVTQVSVGSADGNGDTVTGGPLKEGQQRASGESQPSDFVYEPNAESPTAAVTPIAIAAKDPPCPHRFLLGAAVVKTVQTTMSNQCANDFAVGTRCLLEPIRDGVPIIVAAIKPTFVAQVRQCPNENQKSYRGKKVRGTGEVREISSNAGSGVQSRQLIQIPGAKNILPSDANSATFAQKCDQSEVKHK